MKSSPLVGWLFVLAIGMVGSALLLSKTDPGGSAYHPGLLAGGMGCGILPVLGFTGLRCASGQRTAAQKSGREASEKSTSARQASSRSCLGSLLAFVAILLGVAVFVYLLRALQ